MLKEPFRSRYNTRFAPGTETSQHITSQFINRLVRLLEDYSVRDRLPSLRYLNRVLSGVRGLPPGESWGEMVSEDETHLLAIKLGDTKWDFVFDFIERILDDLEPDMGGNLAALKNEFQNDINILFRTERMLYSIKEGRISPQLPSEVEILETNVLSISAQRVAGRAVVQHLEKARNLLCQRPEPDLENCIKELVSALESTAKILSRDDRMKLRKFLDSKLCRDVLHSAVRDLIKKFYGFASEECGIRHGSGSVQGKVGIEDVIFSYYQALSGIELLLAKVPKDGLLESDTE